MSLLLFIAALGLAPLPRRVTVHYEAPEAVPCGRM
jgi:hypothetical protein